jgi:hypothetical protein
VNQPAPATSLTGRWHGLVSRLRGMAERDRHGVSVYTVRLVFVNGELRHWSKPRFVNLEPGGDTTILDLICQEDAKE